MDLQVTSNALKRLGCFINENWELKRLDDPEARFRWDGALQYDQLGDAVTEWIQDCMVEKYGFEEVWLPAEEDVERSKSTLQPKSLDRGKRVRFGSKALPRLSTSVITDDTRSVEEGEERSEESEGAICWKDPPRSGVFTVDEQDAPRVSPDSLIKHARCNIFISANFWSCERLLVIVQGSGPVRPGQWSRSHCITSSLHVGSIFDYLEIANETNMGVIVLNPNFNQIKLRIRTLDHPVGSTSAQHSYDIPGHSSHISHMLTVYDNFIGPSKASEIYFIANSRGGDSVLQLLNHRLDTPTPTSSPFQHIPSTTTDSIDKRTLADRLRAIAFTDSSHSIGFANNDRVRNLIAERSVNWVSASTPLDTGVPESGDNFGCTCVSAGHSKSEFTSACAVNSVFEFFFGRIVSLEENKPLWQRRIIPFSNPPQGDTTGPSDQKEKVKNGGPQEGNTLERRAERRRLELGMALEILSSLDDSDELDDLDDLVYDEKNHGEYNSRWRAAQQQEEDEDEEAELREEEKEMVSERQEEGEEDDEEEKEEKEEYEDYADSGEGEDGERSSTRRSRLLISTVPASSPTPSSTTPTPTSSYSYSSDFFLLRSSPLPRLVLVAVIFGLGFVAGVASGDLLRLGGASTDGSGVGGGMLRRVGWRWSWRFPFFSTSPSTSPSSSSPPPTSSILLTSSTTLR